MVGDAAGGVAVVDSAARTLRPARRARWPSRSRSSTATPRQYPFHFLPYPSSAFLDGSLAHLPWLQEMPDPLTSAMWSSWVEINPATAARLGIEQGDVVEVASSQGTLRSAAMIYTRALRPTSSRCRSVRGTRRFTRYASGRGENPIELLAPMTEATTGALAWAATRVRISARLAAPDGR